jgi:DNA-binding transcriptional LysR family regulator
VALIAGRRDRPVTPTQLRAFAAVVRLGSVRKAAAQLTVSEAAVSGHVAQLRRELGDRLFTPTAAGLAFTPGGLRLASRAAEILGLQDRTILEVSQAGNGRRLLRVAASMLFAEHAAPGLLELFSARAADLDVELSVHSPREFNALLATRAVDLAIGPRPPDLDESVRFQPFLNYQMAMVVRPDHPLAAVPPSLSQLRDETWLLGPSAAAEIGLVPTILRRLAVPEHHQQIFQSHVAALEEAKRGKGIALAVSFAVQQDIANGDLKRLATAVPTDGVWGIISLGSRDVPPAAAELSRFVHSPRATQAMLRGSGVTVGRFRPSIHVTLWS